MNSNWFMYAICLVHLCCGWIKSVHVLDTISQQHYTKCWKLSIKITGPHHSNTWTRYAIYCKQIAICYLMRVIYSIDFVYFFGADITSNTCLSATCWKLNRKVLFENCVRNCKCDFGSSHIWMLMKSPRSRRQAIRKEPQRHCHLIANEFSIHKWTFLFFTGQQRSTLNPGVDHQQRNRNFRHFTLLLSDRLAFMTTVAYRRHFSLTTIISLLLSSATGWH